MRVCVYTHGVVHRSVGVSNTKMRLAADLKQYPPIESEPPNHEAKRRTIGGSRTLLPEQQKEEPSVLCSSFWGFLGIVFKTLLPKYIEVFVSILSMCAGFFGIANHTHLIEPTNSTSHCECSRINVNCFEFP